MADVFPKSSLIETAERILGFEIESCTPEEIDNLDADELICLAEELDEALDQDSLSVGLQEGSVTPISFADWNINTITQNATFMPLLLINERVLLPSKSIGRS